ncbi:MAG: enoyl-CoA hydratase/isomerase family protein [Dehalococcoidia bacterium]|nr:enoyl-CoA hydratase/isomerase family protein [Dehalococcoidia bacterium]
MDFEFIMLKKENQIATLTLNRPQKKNALNYKMLQEILIAVADVGKDSDVRVMVVTGAGDAFCAGADLRIAELKAGKIGPRHVEEMWVRINEEGFPPGQLLTICHEAIAAIRQVQKPTIAMMKGDAVGGGFGMSLACDMRVAALNTRFMIGHPRIGFVPDLEEAWVLPRMVGLGKALEIIMACEFVSAEEAYRIGLVNRLVPVEKLEEETKKLAKSLMTIPPITQRLIKQTVYAGLSTDRDSAVLLALACNAMIMKSRDHDEATMALIERRAPVYRDANLLFDETGS